MMHYKIIFRHGYDRSVWPKYAFNTEGTLRDFDLLLETLELLELAQELMIYIVSSHLPGYGESIHTLQG
jgi:hypothetical protein